MRHEGEPGDPIPGPPAPPGGARQIGEPPDAHVDVATGSPPPLLVSRQTRLLATAFIVAATGLIPWIVFLGFTLPPRYDAGHWNVLWIGFDVALVAVLGYGAWAAWFRRQILALTASVAGTLLVTDAWFDILTSLGTHDEWVTLLTGFGVELPLSAFFFWLYRRIALGALAVTHQRLGDGPAPRRLRDARLLLGPRPAPSPAERPAEGQATAGPGTIPGPARSGGPDPARR